MFVKKIQFYIILMNIMEKKQDKDYWYVIETVFSLLREKIFENGCEKDIFALLESLHIFEQVGICVGR